VLFSLVFSFVFCLLSPTPSANGATADMKNLQNLKQPNRVQSKGVIVMSERFKTQKATQALIQADLALYPLVIISRKFASSDGHEPGYLCVGQNTITFVGPDQKSVISSHPLAFIESYTADIHNPKVAGDCGTQIAL
jgi:hypothetical protein